MDIVNTGLGSITEEQSQVVSDDDSNEEQGPATKRLRLEYPCNVCSTTYTEKRT